MEKRSRELGFDSRTEFVPISVEMARMADPGVARPATANATSAMGGAAISEREELRKMYGTVAVAEMEKGKEELVQEMVDLDREGMVVLKGDASVDI